MHYFSIFFIDFNKAFVQFLRVWIKYTIYLKFWEDFPKFRKNYSENCYNLFFQRFNKACVQFLRVWTKKHNIQKIFESFWWKFYRKIEFFYFLFLFFYFFENLLLKIEHSEITPFWQHFFRFRDVGNFPLPQWLRPCSQKGIIFNRQKWLSRCYGVGLPIVDMGKIKKCKF